MIIENLETLFSNYLARHFVVVIATSHFFIVFPIIITLLFSKKVAGNKLLFPVGDMFWAKIKSIHQIFKIKFKSLFPDELGQINGTIMHAIERIWLYLVKKNGYYYKTIFNHY